MRFYESFYNYKMNPSLLGEEIYAFNKYDGQNFVAKYNLSKKSFDCFGSRTKLVDENDEQFGNAVKLFKENIESKLINMVSLNNGKKGIFKGVKELEFYFEYVGENSFCGQHNDSKNMQLILIDIWIYKKGYLEPFDFCEITKNIDIKVAEVIYKGILDEYFISLIESNDYEDKNCLFPTVKEGVVCKKIHRKKGQYLPKCKIKTNKWLNKVKIRYPNNWDELI